MSEEHEIPLVRRTFGFTKVTDNIDKKNRRVRFIVSTDAVDSHDEITDQSWILDRYKRNPVVLYNHVSGGWRDTAQTIPIGKAVECEIVNGHLEATLEIAQSDRHPLADVVWFAIEDGRLNAVSAGFRPRDITEERRDGKDILVLRNNELFEISLAPLPANADAVRLSADRVDSREALIRRARSNKQAASGQEIIMDPEKLKAELAETRKAFDDERAKSADLASKAEKLEEKNRELVAKASTAETKAADAEAKLAEAQKTVEKTERSLASAEVEALIGKKLTPAEREDAIEDRLRFGAEKFAERMNKRASLQLTDRVTRDETKGVTSEKSEGDVQSAIQSVNNLLGDK